MELNLTLKETSMNTRQTIAQKIEALETEDVKRMAEALGKTADEVYEELMSMRNRSLYYQSDRAKAAAKRYRESAKAKSQALKALL